jgi:hypothetical protein
VAVPAALAAGGTRIGLKPASSIRGPRAPRQYKAKAGQRELEVEVEHIRRLAGRQVVILVAGAKVGTAKVGALGAAQISRSTERGQRVPRVAAGTSVKVRTARGTGIVFSSQSGKPGRPPASSAVKG